MREAAFSVLFELKESARVAKKAVTWVVEVVERWLDSRASDVDVMP